MSPNDIDEEEVLKLIDGMNTPHTGGVHGLYVDGRVSFLGTNSPAEELRAGMKGEKPDAE